MGIEAKMTTLCYIEKDGAYLMLHRVSKKHDVCKDKWIGVGGHFEISESPEECLLREVKEETGLTLTSWVQRACNLCGGRLGYLSLIHILPLGDLLPEEKKKVDALLADMGDIL